MSGINIDLKFEHRSMPLIGALFRYAALRLRNSHTKVEGTGVYLLKTR